MGRLWSRRTPSESHLYKQAGKSKDKPSWGIWNWECERSSSLWIARFIKPNFEDMIWDLSTYLEDLRKQVSKINEIERKWNKRERGYLTKGKEDMWATRLQEKHKDVELWGPQERSSCVFIEFTAGSDMIQTPASAFLVSKFLIPERGNSISLHRSNTYMDLSVYSSKNSLMTCLPSVYVE